MARVTIPNLRTKITIGADRRGTMMLCPGDFETAKEDLRQAVLDDGGTDLSEIKECPGGVLTVSIHNAFVTVRPATIMEGAPVLEIALFDNDFRIDYMIYIRYYPNARALCNLD